MFLTTTRIYIYTHRNIYIYIHIYVIRVYIGFSVERLGLYNSNNRESHGKNMDDEIDTGFR